MSIIRKLWRRLRRLLPWKLSNIERWIAYRTYDRYHIVKCDGIEPNYWELETRLLHSAFGLLREFVELQMSTQYSWMEHNGSSKLKDHRARGIEVLNWEIDPKNNCPHHQRNRAIECKILYLWWMDERPKRPDPYEESGFAAVDCNCDRRVGNLLVECEHSEARSKCYRIVDQIEEKYRDEDTIMLERLVRLRHELWT